jgi:RND superfamily putative drug exporter
MAPGSLPSSIANEHISKSFGSIADQPTTLIVITSDDVMDERTRIITLAIEREIAEASLYGDINKVEVTSPYTIAENYALNVIKVLNYACSSANLSAYLTFGLPQEYRMVWTAINTSAFALYTVPESYATAWAEAMASNPSLTVEEADIIAYASARSRTDAEAMNLGPEERALLLTWLRSFAGSWNLTAPIGLQPGERAVAARSDAFLQLQSSLDLPERDKWLIQQVSASFATLEVDFRNVSAVAREVVDGRIEASVAKMTSGQASYGNVTSGQVVLVREYMNSFYSWWSGLGRVPSDAEMEHGILVLSLEFGEGISDRETREVFLAVRSSIGGLAVYKDAEARTEAIVAVVASMPSIVERVAPERWLVNASAEMGGFDMVKAKALSRKISSNSSLDHLPFKMPAGIFGQLVSADRTTMIMGLTYEDIKGDLHPGRECVADVRDIVAGVANGEAVRCYVTGTDALNVDMEATTFEDLGIIEPITIVLVLVLIGSFFRSFVASSIPPLSVGVALGISYAAVYIIGSYVLAVHYAVLTLLLTATIGAGCDYCIFILSRYREERSSGKGKEESVRQAVTWAGESILISGLTVIIGFGVLAIGELSLFKSLGVILALSISMALLVALTLLPSVLFLLGDRSFWPARMDHPPRKLAHPSYFSRSARFAIRNAKVLLIVAALMSMPAIYLTLSADTSYDYIGSMADVESKQGLTVIQEGFGGGKITPTQISVVMTSDIVSNGSFDLEMLASIESLSLRIANLDNIKKVNGPTRPFGDPIDITNASLMDEYDAVIGRMVSTDRRAAILTVTFEAEPFDMRSIASVHDLRAVAEEAAGTGGMEKVLVGGSTASMSDIASMNQGDFRNMAVLAVASIYAVLMLVLGSVISPLRSILTILLSISWTLAVALLLFQGLLGQPILYLAPMILLLVCLGLGMDYDILLVTRVREEVAKGMDTDEAIVHAVDRTGGIITACGVIMASAFGSMMLSNGYLLKEFGFVLMFAILLDATVVRIYLVPAAMSLLGRWNWWAPGPIRRMSEGRDRKRLDALKEGRTGK